MYCPNCGTEFGDGVNFCPKCGTKRPQPQSATGNSEQKKPSSQMPNAPEANTQPATSIPNTAQNQPKNTVISVKKKSKLPLIVGILGIIVVAIIVIAALFRNNDSPEISTVRNGYLGEFTDMTVDKVLDGYYSELLGYGSGTWDSGVTDDGTTIVQVEYTNEELGPITIQFSMLNEDCFKITAFVDPLEDIERPTDLLDTLNKIYMTSYERQYPLEKISEIESELLTRLASVNATSVRYGASKNYEGDRSQLYTLFDDTQLDMNVIELLDLYGLVDGSAFPDTHEDLSSNGAQDTMTSAIFSSGTFSTTSDTSVAYENGGIVVELAVNDNQVMYTVTSISESQRIASISGTASQGNMIHAKGDDGWGNIVEGDIAIVDDDSISVEFEVVTPSSDAMWQLNCSYAVLTRCSATETTVTSSYPIQIRMDNLMSANILGDTFWSAYENGWLEEWMSLYVNEGSDPNVVYEPFWYDEQLGEWTYYGITYSQAEEAGWGDVWTEILENNGYSRYA